MADVFSKEKRSQIMRAVKASGTSAEIAVLRFLRRQLRATLGTNDESLPGSPDVVIKSLGAVIMVNGCFWHGHGCPRGRRIPKSNRKYWLAKVGRNRTRDRRTARQLRSMGWRVFTLWECQLTPTLGEARMQRLLGSLRRGVC